MRTHDTLHLRTVQLWLVTRSEDNSQYIEILCNYCGAISVNLNKPG